MDIRNHPAAVPFCPVIAREGELRTLAHLWRSSRLVTLYGQCGVGKSALARAAAERLAEEENGKVHWIDAGGAMSGVALLRLLARARWRSSGRGSADCARLPEDPSCSAPSFLVLDDLPAAARAATRGLLQWLVVNPTVHMLVVTDHPLDLLGERTYALAPLSTGDAAASPAAELFRLYAQLSRSGAAPVAPEIVSAICQALDGLPAALEAAAGLLGVLPEPEIVRICREEPLSLCLRGRSLREIVASTWADLPNESRDYLIANADCPTSFDDEAATPWVGPDLGVVPHLLQIGLLQIVGSQPRLRCRIASLVCAWLVDSGLASAPLPTAREAGAPRSPRPPVASRPPLLVRLLGPLAVEGPNGSLTARELRPKEQRVLARLALSPGAVVPRDELLDLFWHDSPVAAAERSLRTVVSSLRGSLRSLLAEKPPRLISGRLDGYRLETETCAVDADRFAKAIQAARGAAASTSPPDQALAEWRRAEELYRGDLLVAFLYEDWCLTQRERLRNDFLDALFQLARAAMESGDLEDARRRAARMVDIDVTEERAHRLLMRCHVLLDRPAEALRQFERCRAALWEELAARPSPATLALLHAIREGMTFSDDDDEIPEPPAFPHAALLR